MIRKMFFWIFVLVAFSAACSRETEDPRTRANRIADEVLGDSRVWHEIAGSAFVWTACRKGQEGKEENLG